MVYGAGCHDILYSHCTAYNCNWGGAAGDSGGSSTLNGITIDHCHFYNWQNWETSNNQDHHNGFYTWAESGGWASNITYSANYVGPGYGAQNTSGMFITGASYSVLVFNNIFDTSDGSAPANAPLNIGCGSTTTVRIFNNTFIGNRGVAVSGGVAPGMPSYYIYNNEFYMNTTAILVWYGSQSFVYSDTNNFYGNPQFNSSFGATWGGTGNSISYAQWQAAGNGTGVQWDTHSMTGNPLLNSDFSPATNSLLIGAGMNFTSLGITTDYNGNTRPSTGPWTIGAFEFQAALSWPAPEGSPWFW
jgi:hypothetical protein